MAATRAFVGPRPHATNPTYLHILVLAAPHRALR